MKCGRACGEGDLAGAVGGAGGGAAGREGGARGCARPQRGAAVGGAAEAAGAVSEGVVGQGLVERSYDGVAHAVLHARPLLRREIAQRPRLVPRHIPCACARPHACSASAARSAQCAPTADDIKI
jgi:hypothetical protein